VYRAATVSITPPEAATYNRFVGPEWRDALSLTTANNHVFYTLLARLSTSAFHLTDLALRLPSLLGCALYFWAVFRLARRNFACAPLFLAAVALLALNPLVLDYFSMARGYGLALAFWMCSLQLILECDTGSKLNLAGICMGLSISCNLAFVVPAVALGMAFSFSPSAGPVSVRLEKLWLPAFLTAFLVLVIPLNHMDWHTFQQGATSLRQTLNSLTALSLYHENPARLPIWLAIVARWIAGILAVLSVITGLIGAHRLGWLMAGTIAGGFIALEVGHRWLRLPFPLGRSGLYFIPVLTLAALALVQRIDWKPLEWALLGASCVYLFGLNMNWYAEWPEFAHAREAIKAIRQDAGNGFPRVGASAGWAEVLNYYRSRYGLRLWPPVAADPHGSVDYYVLDRDRAGLAIDRHLQLIWQDGNVVVARSSR